MHGVKQSIVVMTTNKVENHFNYIIYSPNNLISDFNIHVCMDYVCGIIQY